MTSRGSTVKYTETLLLTTPMTTTGAFVQLTAIPQGSQQFQRIADTAWIERVDISYSVTTANADIFNLARLTFFRWTVSSALASPTTGELYSNYSNALVHSFFNFERRANYKVLMDNVMNLSGIATSPTSCRNTITSKNCPEPISGWTLTPHPPTLSITYMCSMVATL